MMKTGLAEKKQIALKIEKAMISDATMTAKLTHMAHDTFSYEIFGTSDDDLVLRLYENLWVKAGNRFNPDYSYVIRQQSKPIALITCYGGHMTSKFLLPTARDVFAERFFPYLWHNITHLSHLYGFLRTIEAYHDEFYIASVAVLPEYRGYSIGSKLINHAENLARDQDYKKISLLCRVTNTGAKRLYERHDYQVKEVLNRKPFNFYRMVKEL